LIGPNGAGKTTFIDAVTGFVRPTSGSFMLDDQDVSSWNAARRARSGLARSFQSLELFDDLTVRENLAVACDNAKKWRYLGDFVWPGRSEMSSAARSAIDHFNLEPYLESKPEALPYGIRRLVAIARAVSAEPSVLLLDEPAAGLGDEEAAELASMISTLAESWGIGVLLVEHNIDVVLSVAHTVTVLDAGAVLIECAPGDVQSSTAVREAYLGVEETPVEVEALA
jgi:sulfate-transporting ATPase